MNTQLIITLAVLVFMAVSFMVRKISFGLTGMICMLALAVTGVIDLNTAFSGFSNKTTIMVENMMMVVGCLPFRRKAEFSCFWRFLVSPFY